jgi:hypothetical protein
MRTISAYADALFLPNHCFEHESIRSSDYSHEEFFIRISRLRRFDYVEHFFCRFSKAFCTVEVMPKTSIISRLFRVSAAAVFSINEIDIAYNFMFASLIKNETAEPLGIFS